MSAGRKKGGRKKVKGEIVKKYTLMQKVTKSVVKNCSKITI